MKAFLLTAATAAACAVPAMAANVNPSKDGGDLIAGSGISGSDFSTASGTGGSVFLKVRHDISGGHDDAPLSYDSSTNTYRIDSGMSSGNRSLLQFDYQFTPTKNTALADYDSLNLRIDFDIDPTADTDFKQFSFTPVFITGAGSDGYFVTNNGGQGSSDGTGTDNSTWSDQDYEFVYSNSWQAGFVPSIGIGNFANEPGEYDIRFSAIGQKGSDVFVTTVSAKAIAVPEPLTLTGGMTLLGAVGLRRRRLTA